MEEHDLVCPCCKYHSKAKYDKNFNVIQTEGDEPFVAIKTSHSLTVNNPEEECPYDQHYKKVIEVQLMGCPKCKTVQFIY